MATSLSIELTIEAFGKQLLDTLDLDPVYVALVRAELPPEQLSKWLLGYWCFYHCGLASYLSELENNDAFWDHMMVAAINENKQYPRSSERRHFRGKAAVTGVNGLQERFAEPLTLLTELHSRQSFVAMSTYVKSWPQFGPWIAFKVCDMSQAVLGIDLNVEGANLALYEEPAKGARIAYRNWHPEAPDTWLNLPANYYVSYAMQRLKEEFKNHTAPPHHNRDLNVFEIETILCKWKSHLNGHYPVGKDTNEIRHGLSGWGKTAGLLSVNLP